MDSLATRKGKTSQDEKELRLEELGYAELQEIVKQIKLKLETAYFRFDIATDDKLIDACIYEINALTAQLEYLLMLSKNQKMQEVNTGGVK